MADESEDTLLLTDARVKYRSFGSILANVLVITLSFLYFGYTLAYFSTIPTVEIMNKFGIDEYIEKPSSVQGLFSGLIPVGAGIGALMSSVISSKFSRRNSIIFTGALSILGGALLFIPNFFSLLIGRAIQGLCVGLYSAIGPLFINQFAPLEISGRLGALNQLNLISGILLTNVLALFVPEIVVPDDAVVIADYPIWDYWWIIFGLPLVIAAVQIILLLTLFRNETPRYLYSVGRDDDALELIKLIYKDQYVEEIVRQKKGEVRKVVALSAEQLVSTYDDNDVGNKSRNLCAFVAIHLGLLQNMCGINVVILYGGETINKAVSNVTTSKWIQLALIASQFLACLGTSVVLKKVGRKTILQIGTLISFLVLAVVGVAFVFMENNSTAQQILVIASLAIFMISFGFSLGPVIWLYIAEIVPAKIIPYSTLSNWTGGSITIILFPILANAIGNSGYLYFALSLWCLISFFINQKYAVETMGKTERQIKQDFDKLVN